MKGFDLKDTYPHFVHNCPNHHDAVCVELVVYQQPPPRTAAQREARSDSRWCRTFCPSLFRSLSHCCWSRADQREDGAGGEVDAHARTHILDGGCDNARSDQVSGGGMRTCARFSPYRLLVPRAVCSTQRSLFSSLYFLKHSIPRNAA